MISTCRGYRGSRGACVALAVILTSVAMAQDKEYRERERRRLDHQLLFTEEQQPVESLKSMASTACVGGFAGSYPCKDIDLAAFMPLATIGGGSGNDIWGWTDPMTGKEYAIMGRTNGTSFVDISDPENPVYLGNLPPHGANSPWRDIKVYADHAYIVSEALGHGMQVFDLTQLRTVVSPPVAFAETAHYDDFGNAHNVAINEDTGFAYAVGTGTCAGGPHFVDLQVPAAPVFAGCHIETIYTHDTQCVVYSGPDAEHQGREICVNSNESQINIIDVTDKANPAVLSQTTYTGWSYVHQGWLTEDQVYYLQGDEGDEQNFGHNTRTRIFDVSDLDAPVLIGTYDASTAAIDHNLYTLRDYVYEANYRAGLRILDLADVGAGVLTEVAYFDIYPSSDGASFNGAWSVYPYFGSGTVVVSGIEQGLFILKPQLPPDFQLELAPAQVQICDPGSSVSTVALTDRNGYVGSVSLSVSGLPAGASFGFSTDPVAVPGTSDLTITASGVMPGSYMLTVSATDGTLMKEEDLTLDVTDAIPGQPGAVMPADGASDVSRTPTLQWTAVAQAFTYDLEVATDPGFASIVYSVSTEATSHTIPTALAPTTTFYWRVRSSNACGVGLDSTTASFTTLAIPPILLVDDDDNGPDVRASYTDTLLVLGEGFEVWDTANSDDEPSAAALGPYATVIWFTGDEAGGAAGPGGGGESALASWLDSSRCLLISSQDYHYDRGLTGFMQSYLGVESVTNDVGQTEATGQAPVFGGLGPYTLSFPYSNFTDVVNPDVTAGTAFRGTPARIAVYKDTGLYRTTYWSFGLETLPTATDREAVLGTFLGWCDALSGLDGDGDGTANGDDCSPNDGDLWSAPSPAQDLVVGSAAPDNLSWQPPAVSGATAVLYDVLRSTDPADFGGAVCVESAGGDTVATDTSSPLPGELYCYLVRVYNACGETLGNDPERTGGSCP